MKRRRKGLRGYSAGGEAAELKLYAENDGDLYRQMLRPIQKNLCAKRKKGTFDESKAPKAFLNFANVAARKYCKELSCSKVWNKEFTMTARREMARTMARQFQNTPCSEYGFAGLGRARRKR